MVAKQESSNHSPGGGSFWWSPGSQVPPTLLCLATVVGWRKELTRTTWDTVKSWCLRWVIQTLLSLHAHTDLLSEGWLRQPRPPAGPAGEADVPPLHLALVGQRAAVPCAQLDSSKCWRVNPGLSGLLLHGVNQEQAQAFSFPERLKAWVAK